MDLVLVLIFCCSSWFDVFSFLSSIVKLFLVSKEISIYLFIIIKILNMPKAEGPEAFFGYIGVACALVFASKFDN